MTSSNTALGKIALAAALVAALHDGYHVLRGELHDLLWFCNLAVPFVALGCWLRAATPVGIALCWLAFGTPVWLIDILSGGEVIPTSFLTHLIGPLLAIAAVRALGWVPGTWLRATLAAAALLLVTRVLTEARYNVNLAFAVWPGWERTFPNYTAYLAMLGALAAASFYLVERLASALLARRTETSTVIA